MNKIIIFGVAIIIIFVFSLIGFSYYSCSTISDSGGFLCELSYCIYGFSKSSCKHLIMPDSGYGYVIDNIHDDLLKGEKRISIPNRDFVISRGASQALTVGVRNKKDTPLHYKIRFTPISGPDGAPFSIDNPPWFPFAHNQVDTLSAADSAVRNIRLSIPTNVDSGSYSLTFDVIDDDLPSSNNIYAQQVLYIIVQ